MTVYHAIKPGHLPEIYEPQSEAAFSGWQSVGWNTDMALANSTYQGLSMYGSVNPYFDDDTDDHLTVQFQHWWGEAAGQNMWHWSYYGINTTVSMGANVRVLSHGGDAISYGTFYLRGVDTSSGDRWWLQYSFFDERGDLPDMFRFDPYTQEAVLESQIDNGLLADLNPASGGMLMDAHSDIQFKGVEIDRFDFVNTFTEMNNQLGTNFSLEPGFHQVIAYGVTYEMGQEYDGQLGWLEGEVFESFVRTEWGEV